MIKIRKFSNVRRIILQAAIFLIEIKENGYKYRLYRQKRRNIIKEHMNVKTTEDLCKFDTLFTKKLNRL